MKKIIEIQNNTYDLIIFLAELLGVKISPQKLLSRKKRDNFEGTFFLSSFSIISYMSLTHSITSRLALSTIYPFFVD